MMTILIGAGVSGFVLGATSRIVFLLPVVLMALVVAGVLIVRADIDLGFTALAASLLNGGFLLGVVIAPVMEEARQIAVNVGKLPGLARRVSASAPA